MVALSNSYIAKFRSEGPNDLGIVFDILIASDKDLKTSSGGTESLL